jgi:hypothetical protein
LIALEETFEEALEHFVDASWEQMTAEILDQEIIKGSYPD